MNQLSKKRIEMIINKTTSGSALTMYIPTHQIPTRQHMDEDKIRFKNNMQKALKLIKKTDQMYFHSFLEKKYKELMDNNLFWEQCTKSMLITARLGMFEVTHLPVDCDEYVALDDHFHLGPIYGLLYDMQTYYVLHVAHKGPELFMGDNYGIKKMFIDLPESVEEALNIDEAHMRSVQHHSARDAAASKTGGGAMYHGHGGAKDTGDADYKMFLKIIDQRLLKSVDDSLPLVLAGADHEVNEFRSVSNHGNILDTPVTISNGATDINKLHQASFEIIQQEVIDARRRMALATFKQLHARSPEKTVSDVDSLSLVTSEGRADTILLAVWKKTTDTVRDNSGQVRKLVLPLYRQHQAIDDVLERAWQQGAKIVNILGSQSPTNSLVAAKLRY